MFIIFTIARGFVLPVFTNICNQLRNITTSFISPNKMSNALYDITCSLLIFSFIVWALLLLQLLLALRAVTAEGNTLRVRFFEELIRQRIHVYYDESADRFINPALIPE